MIDCHCHSKFSPDSSADPEEQIAAALKTGIRHITVTEHVDYPYSAFPLEDGEKTFTCEITDEYYDVYSRLRDKYAGRVTVTIGLEIGFSDEDLPYILKTICNKPYEYIVSSVHVAGGMDLYWKRFYRGKTKKQVFEEYLCAVRRSLGPPYSIDAVGHIGYISRYCPFDDPVMTYVEFADLIDDILKELVRRDIMLELNGHGCDRCRVLPHFSVLKRYRELGGKLVTFGSDAHTPNELGKNYSEAREMAKGAGFDRFVYKYDGNILEEKI